MEDFGLCLTLDVGQSGAPDVEDFSLWLTLDVSQSGIPGVEDFSLWLTLDVGQSIALRGGLCHFGLVKHMVGHWFNFWSVTKNCD